MELVDGTHRRDHGMINRLTILLLFCLTLASVGCTSPWHKKEVQAARISEPPLSESMTSKELVELLNRQNSDLQGWRSTSARMEVRVPNLPRQKLNDASIACQSPNYFRLTASGLIASADLGSNNKRCWFYVTPGEKAVMTWRHEDTPLLQHIPEGVPYVDPSWLMLVLGVTPLDADEYRIRSNGSILELAKIEDTASGRPVRSVIRVDRTRRVVREHAIYDSEGHKLVGAMLGTHRWVNNKLIPHSVTLDFPQMRSEIRLTFRDIETNPNLPDALWHLPDHDLRVVDLGDLIRNKLMADSGERYSSAANAEFYPPQIELQNPEFGDAGQAMQRSAFVPSTSQTAPESNSFAAEEIPEPEWSVNPISHTRSIPASNPSPAARRPKRGFFGRIGF